jgi:ribokinase
MNRAPRIAVVGSANVDLTTFTDRFPRAGETIFGREFHLGFGGKGANQAFAARLCGAHVSMIARVGDDLFGPATLENFRAAGIETTHVRLTPGVSSGVAPIFVDTSGQNRILVVKGANDRLSPADIDAAAEVLTAADFIILQLEVPLQTVYYTLRFAHKHNLRTILNPAPGQALDPHEIAHADYLIPNETEAETITGIAVQSIDDARTCARQLLNSAKGVDARQQATRKLAGPSGGAPDNVPVLRESLNTGVQRVVITLGANGALFAERVEDEQHKIEHIPSFPVTAVDTTGAGDAFIGSLACFLARGLAHSEAIARANLYAALSTLAVGTQKSFVTRERFEAEWDKTRSRESRAPAGK